jgi:retron-type reverse transcriptase
MPPPVRAVEIPKRGGSGVRTLGVPTVVDRIAQTVATLYLEPEVEPCFHPDSYGYRPVRRPRFTGHLLVNDAIMPSPSDG